MANRDQTSDDIVGQITRYMSGSGIVIPVVAVRAPFLAPFFINIMTRINLVPAEEQSDQHLVA